MNNSGVSPLHYAACAQHPDIFQVLVFRGANLFARIGNTAEGATAAELFPPGLLRIQDVIARKEQDIRSAIRTGQFFLSPRSPPAPAARTADSRLPNQSQVSPQKSGVVPASPSVGTSALDSDSDSVLDDDEMDDGWADSAATEAPAESASAQAAELLLSAPVALRMVGGIEPPVFKDSPLRIRLQLVPNAQAGGSARDVQRCVARSDGRMRIVLTVEDAHGGAVGEVAKGRRSGARIVNQHEFEAQVAADGTAELANVRIREVSRNHAGGAFRLVIAVDGSETIAPAVTRPFHVLSERIRAPSYRNQISRQRERRMRRAQGAHSHSSRSTNRDDSDM